MCLLKHRSRPVSILEINFLGDVFSTNFTFKLMSWPMGTRRNFCRWGASPKNAPTREKSSKKAPTWRKRLPISL